MNRTRTLVTAGAIAAAMAAPAQPRQRRRQPRPHARRLRRRAAGGNNLVAFQLARPGKPVASATSPV